MTAGNRMQGSPKQALTTKSYLLSRIRGGKKIAYEDKAEAIRLNDRADLTAWQHQSGTARALRLCQVVPRYLKA